MLKQFSSIIGFFFVLAMTVCVNAFTTGELITMDKEVPDWPPLALQRPEMQHTFDSENFKIHYDTEGENEVYHAGEDINPPDGIPDYINHMAYNLEAAHYVFLTEMGFDRPPPDEGFGGDDRYDIYVTQTTGLTVPEFQSDYYPNRYAYASYAFIGNDLRNQQHPDNPYPFMMATCVHEYFHAVQMAYRAYTSDEPAWWYELTAMWAEEMVFDELNEVYYYLDNYYLKINRSIYLTGGTHMYGAWVFAEYLSQNYSYEIIKMIFEELIGFEFSLDAIITTLENCQLDFNMEFTLFACWNYFTSGNVKPGFFEEGADFPVSVPISALHYEYPVAWQNSVRGVENLGAAYIYFGNADVDKGDLVIMFESDPDYPEGLCVAGIYNDRDIELVTYKLDPDETIEVRVEDFYACNSAILCIVGSYEGYPVFDSSTYAYSAFIDSTPVGIVSDEGNLANEFKLSGNYPNPFNLSTEITFYWNNSPVDYKITVYDIAGRVIDALEGQASPGVNRVNWKAKDSCASGVFFYKLVVGDNDATGRMLLLK